MVEVWHSKASKEIKDMNEDKTSKFNDAINNNFNTFSWPKKLKCCENKKVFFLRIFLH